jgi:hypothetical protein
MTVTKLREWAKCHRLTIWTNGRHPMWRTMPRDHWYWADVRRLVRGPGEPRATKHVVVICMSRGYPSEGMAVRVLARLVGRLRR